MGAVKTVPEAPYNPPEKNQTSFLEQDIELHVEWRDLSFENVVSSLPANDAIITQRPRHAFNNGTLPFEVILQRGADFVGLSNVVGRRGEKELHACGLQSLQTHHTVPLHERSFAKRAGSERKMRLHRLTFGSLLHFEKLLICNSTKSKSRRTSREGAYHLQVCVWCYSLFLFSHAHSLS